jgi:hypothetical protein
VCVCVCVWKVAVALGSVRMKKCMVTSRNRGWRHRSQLWVISQTLSLGKASYVLVESREGYVLELFK